MGILGTAGKDLTTASTDLEQWLRHDARLGPTAVVVELRDNDGGSGFSNETLFALVDSAAGRTEYVVRHGPRDPAEALFPDNNIRRQYDVVQALRREGSVPVPEALWFEADDALFGSPFYLMRKLEGRVPADSPPYAKEGMIVDATTGQQRTLWCAAIDTLAAVGRVDPARAGLGFLAWPDRSRSPLENHIAEFEQLYRWGRQDSPPFPEMERAITWLYRQAPLDGPVGLQWGDARLTNFMFDPDHQCIAALDWELATLGDPECDLAYFLFYQRWSEDHYIPELSAPRPAGFPSTEETVERYARAAGRPVRHLDYYMAFNAFKSMAMYQRFTDLMVGAGMLDKSEAEASKMSGGNAMSWLMQIVDG